MSTPPFCQLGNKYDVNLFNNSSELSAYTNIDPKIIISGGKLTQTNDPIDDGGATLKFSTLINDPAYIDINLNCSMKTDYAETFTYGVGIVIKSSGGTTIATMLMKLVYDPNPTGKYKLVCILPSASINHTVKTDDYTEYSFNLRLTNDASNSKIYLDNTLILTGNPFTTGVGGFYIWPQVQTTTTYNKYGNILDITYIGADFSTTCQGEIPTYHRVAPASTLKATHYRRIKEHRTPGNAQAFHDQIKAML